MNPISQALTTVAESPTAADATPVEQLGADVQAESSTASHDASEESSPAKGAKKATLSDAISKALGPLEEETEGEAAAETPTDAKAESEAKSADEPGGKKDEPAAPEKKDEPFDDSSLKGKARERIEGLVREVKQYKPIVETLRKYAGDENGLQNMVALVRNHAENPAEAVPMLEFLLKDARERAGLVVKSADVKQKLDDGLIDEPTALELEQGRAAKSKAKADAEARAAEQATQAQHAQVTALDAWEKNVKGRDPGFDGVSDRVRDRFIALATQNRPETPEDAVALAQQAYDEVIDWAKSRLPAAKPQKVATSSGSSTSKATARPKTINALVDRLL